MVETFLQTSLKHVAAGLPPIMQHLAGNGAGSTASSYKGRLH
jgi:hypothetical protein